MKPTNERTGKNEQQQWTKCIEIRSPSCQAYLLQSSFYSYSFWRSIDATEGKRVDDGEWKKEEDWNDANILVLFRFLHRNNGAARQEGGRDVHIFTTFNIIVHAAHPISPNSIRQIEKPD